MLERRKERARYEEKLKKLREKATTISGRINEVKCKSKSSTPHLLTPVFLLARGFAFSGEAGNDKLVTESLTNRIAAALRHKIHLRLKEYRAEKAAAEGASPTKEESTPGQAAPQYEQ